MRIKSLAVAAACAWLSALIILPAAVSPAGAQAIDKTDATSRLIIKLRPGASTSTWNRAPLAMIRARFTAAASTIVLSIFSFID